MRKPSFMSAILARQGVVLAPGRSAPAEPGRRSLMVAVMLTAVFALTGNAFAITNTTIPFADTFETTFPSYYTNGTPLINGTNGWYGDSSAIIVQTNTVLAGAQAAMIPTDCTLSNLFNIPNTNLWTQMDVRPTLYDGTNSPVVDTNQAGMFYINTSGYFLVHNGPATNPSPTNSASWVLVTNGGIGTSGTNWVSVSINQHYDSKTWDLYVGNPLTLVTNNIRFVNTNLTNLTGFSVYNGATTSYLDYVYVNSSTVTVLSIGGTFSVSNKVYDASTTAAITNSTLTLVGTNGTDAVTLTAVAAFDNKNVGTGKVVNLTGSWLAGADALKYKLSLAGAPTATANITNAPLTATLVSTITKTYNGTYAATNLVPANYALTGLAGSETSAVNQMVGTYATSNAGSGIAVTATLASVNFPEVGGFLTNNYTLPTSAAGNVGVINKKTLTATLVPTISKTYDRLNTATLGVTNYSLTGLVGSETSAVNQTVGAYATTNVGAAIAVTATLVSTNFSEGAGGFLTTNYTLPSSATGNVGVITSKTLTIGGSFQVANKPCDSTTAATITNNILSLVGVISPDVVTINAVAVFSDMNVGNGKTVYLTGSTLAGADAGNYTLSLVGAPTTTANITTNNQTITFPAIPAQPLTNGTLTLIATASPSGLTVTFTNISGPGTIVGNVITFNGVGENTVTASQAGDANYAAAAPVTRTFPVYGLNPKTNTIPFHDTFEGYFNLEPLINGTNGWYGNSVGIIVQTNIFVAGAGTKAAMLPFDVTLSNRFVSASPTNVWIQMDSRPSLYDSTNPPVVDTNAAWMFYINTNGNFWVHNGPASPTPTNSTNWILMTNISIGTTGTNWVQIGIYEDFTKTNWDLYTKTNWGLPTAWVLVTNAIGFINTNLTNFTGFDIYDGASTSYLDNIHVTAPGTILVSPTNLIENAQQGFAATQQICVLTAQTGEWYFTTASSTNWLTVSPSTGTVDAAIIAGTNLTVNFDSIPMPYGSYTGSVTVSATNTDGVPRTLTIPVTLNVLGVSVYPNDLTVTNGFMYSNELVIPSQEFTITNNGTLNAPYTIQPQGDTTNWLWLSASNGTVAVAEATNITVNYKYGMTNGVYTGAVWVTTMLGGGSTSPVRVAVTVVARPVITLNPLIVTQTVAKGARQVTKQFSIWNGSAVPKAPMNYTLSFTNGSPALIQSLDPGGGESTGQVNLVTINYMDISIFDVGVYTATVYVTARDTGTTYAPTGTVQVSTTLVVQVTVTALNAPSGVTASDGTYTDHVAVNWNPVAGAVNYIVYSSETFDWTLAAPIGAEGGTNFNDLTGQAGVRYYYWVSAVNSDRGEGPKSTNLETGYRGLAAPGGLFATDGAYTNKVRVTWPLVDGATGYQLYRGVEGAALAPIYFTAVGVYNDVSVVGGVHYEYKVGATNGIFGSTLSVGETGYAFGAPGGLTASKGTYVDKVRVTWNAVDSASEYEVWRSAHAILPPGGGAVKMATVTTPVFDDSSVSAGATYYYWVRAHGLEAGIGGWSGMDRGYGASAGVDLWVTNLVVLPVQVGLGGSPVIVSFRMGNGGGTNMAGANGTVGMEFFASTNQVLGAAGNISMGKVVSAVTLEVGADMVMKVAGSQLVAPTTEGDYNIFVRVLPELPSLLADTNPDDNVAKRNGSVRVRSSGGLNYQVFNDYDGDGMSDLGVYRGMAWSIRSVDERVLVSNYNFFGGAGLPVLGDLDGDRIADPMVFDSASGLWQILCSGSGYRLLSGEFGGAGFRGLVADYEGVEHGDASVFHEGNGRWYVLKSDGGMTIWNWGEAGYEPVIGDYDGDGRWDMAVYQETTGLWYIRPLNGQWFISGAFGGPGCSPVSGDYDGDGRWDVAVYVQATGLWYIFFMNGQLALGIEWGGPGFEPVMGDYDGNGKWDLGLYQEATGLWYIGSLDGRILAWASHWGGSSYRPIGK